jgi:hypothetical protein
VSEKGYLRAVLGIGARGAHAKKRTTLDERLAARARLYRRSLAVTGIVWCGALVLDHAQPSAAVQPATTPNSLLVAATAAEGGPLGRNDDTAASVAAASAAAASRAAGAAAPAEPSVGPRLIGLLGAEAQEARGGVSVAARPVELEVAAASCPGLPWQVLGAIAQVETGGGHMEVSAAGAVGPMQLLPTTWARYRPDGEARIDDFQDSATAAARLLCANGAPGDLRQALWDYNHSRFYVDQVLSLAAGMGIPAGAVG